MSQQTGFYPTYEQMDEYLYLLRMIAGKSSSAEAYDTVVTTAANGENTTKLFWAWYGASQTGNDDRYDLLCRFFVALANAWKDKTYTLRYYKYDVSNSSEMTPLDDLEGKTAAPCCTPASSNTFHWTDEDPMYWYIRGNALSLSDGTMNILAFEGEQGFDITGTTAPVYTFKMAKWKKEWESGSYRYISWRTTQLMDYVPYAADVDPNGNKRAVTWLPTFPGGLVASTGALTSGAGIKPYTFVATTTGLTDARKTTAYEGLWSDQDTTALLHDWQFRHFNLENSGILEGCTDYNYQYTVAVAESNVSRVIMTTANGDKYIVGSCVSVGDPGESTNYDRGQAHMRNIIHHVKIASKEEVVIDGTTYTALNLDTDSVFTTTATTKVSTMPWYSGETEIIPGHKDGTSGDSATSAKYPVRIAGVEVLEGAYATGLDPLYNVTANAESTYFDYAIYECRDSVNLSGSITANYVNTGLSYEHMKQGWNYIKSFQLNDKGILFPEEVAGDSTHWYKSAFHGTSSAGVRVPYRFGNLRDTGNAGLACLNGYDNPSNSGWYIRPRLSGSGKKRGEWQA